MDKTSTINRAQFLRGTVMGATGIMLPFLGVTQALQQDK
jgi:hypothetical protein